MDAVVQSSRSENLIIVASFNMQTLCAMIDRYPNKKIYLGDGTYGANLQIGLRDNHLGIYYGYNSWLLNKHGNPFVVNLMDSLLVISYTVSNNLTTPMDVNIVDYNGDTKFINTRVKKIWTYCSS